MEVLGYAREMRRVRDNNVVADAIQPTLGRHALRGTEPIGISVIKRIGMIETCRCGAYRRNSVNAFSNSK